MEDVLSQFQIKRRRPMISSRGMALTGIASGTMLVTL